MLLDHREIVRRRRGRVRSDDLSWGFRVFQTLTTDPFVRILCSITSLPVVLLLHGIWALGCEETFAHRVANLSRVSCRRLHLVWLHHGLWSFIGLTATFVWKCVASIFSLLHLLLAIRNAILLRFSHHWWLLIVLWGVCNNYVCGWELLVIS